MTQQTKERRIYQLTYKMHVINAPSFKAKEHTTTYYAQDMHDAELKGMAWCGQNSTDVYYYEYIKVEFIG